MEPKMQLKRKMLNRQGEARRCVAPQNHGHKTKQDLKQRAHPDQGINTSGTQLRTVNGREGNRTQANHKRKARLNFKIRLETQDMTFSMGNVCALMRLKKNNWCSRLITINIVNIPYLPLMVPEL